ncbi:phosphonopyruvate decarboxylase [Streptomyces sp. NPDC004126]|uniref:phosphonopyruvate decarboxylase n=1 Tax=Streptomyces sp. NPDC004126 TaxID=3390695 RepID=UPI003D05AF45
MIATDDFCDSLAARGIDLVSGVPCSHFAGPIVRLTREGRYVAAANEGAALAIAGGAAAAGRRSAVIAQNSGLGNLINPLTSLHMTYGIPTLVFMSLRGWPDPGQDEPQHAVMGVSTHALLDAVGVPHVTVRAGETGLERALDAAEPELRRGRAVFVLTEKGAVAGCRTSTPPGARLTRIDALQAMLPLLDRVPLISTTGYTSRELYAVTASKSHFYMQGSMGHAGAFGLGVALSRPADAGPVVVLDGDGAALMHLGTFSTVGATAPRQLVHVVFDNGAYESTGAQLTTSATTDFAAVALATGYVSARTCTTAGETADALAAALASAGPHLVVVRVGSDGSEAPPRATSAMTAQDIRLGFGTALEAREPWPPALSDRVAAEPAAALEPAAAEPPAGWPPAGPEIISGPGSAGRLPEVLDASGARRVLVVASDRALARSGVLGLLGDRPHRVFSGFRANPDLDDVLAGCALRDDWGPDLVLGVGGGSALDVAKMVRILPADRTAALDQLHGRAAGEVRHRVSGPLVLVPTTAGTGSEVTQFATVFDGDRKLSLDHECVTADIAVVDARLAGSCPAHVTSSCAFDALCHAVESYWARRSTPRSREHAARALRLLLPLTLTGGTGITAPTAGERETLATASMEAGRAITITRTTAAHACAYALTRTYGVPHGVACLLNLQWLYAYNREHAASGCTDARGPEFLAERLAELDELTGAGGAAGGSAAHFGRMLTEAGWSNRLRDHGVPRDGLPELVAGISSVQRAANNPVRLDEAAVLAALESIH